jgi:polysaccharide biosynthesis/export protein
MKKKLLSLVLLVIFVSSCVPKKRLTYLQEAQIGTTYKLDRSLYKIQPNDILSITIRSFDQETSQYFNISNTGSGSSGALNAGDILFYLQGYSVDLVGYISIPIVGDILVRNKTIEEVEELVLNSLKVYFQQEAVSVTVQLAGIRYSVVGEVSRPGKYVIYQNQVNIFEALALAGDITIVGDRREVMILRQMEDGVKPIYLNLTDSEVINSPDFFVQPNDIINVKPLPQKSFGIGTTGFQTFSQLLSVIASTITLVIAINSLN